MNRLFRYIFIIFAIIGACCLSGCSAPRGGAPLGSGLRSENFWTRVHAAEFLLDLGADKEKIAAGFTVVGPEDNSSPFRRIGVARVLVRCGVEPERHWNVLRGAALEIPPAPDRNHALETLGKLNWHPSAKEERELRKLWMADELPENTRIYAAWSVIQGSEAFLCSIIAFPAEHQFYPVALRALASRADLSPETLATVSRLIDDHSASPAARAGAVRILLRHGVMSPAEALRRYDELPAEDVHGERCRLLAEFVPPGTEAELRSFLRDPDIELAMTAEWGLVRRFGAVNFYGAGF